VKTELEQPISACLSIKIGFDRCVGTESIEHVQCIQKSQPDSICQFIFVFVLFLHQTEGEKNTTVIVLERQKQQEHSTKTTRIHGWNEILTTA
jgi:hypothetical protein